MGRTFQVRLPQQSIMKAYLATSGTIFGLLVVAHIWRLSVEGTHLAREPFFVLVTVAAAGLSAWGLRLFLRANSSR